MQQQLLSAEIVCIAESSFIAVVVTISMLCVLFSSVIVTWACRGRKDKAQQTAQQMS